MGFSGGKYKPSEIHNDQGGPGDYAEAHFDTDNGYHVRIFGKNGTIEVTDPDGGTYVNGSHKDGFILYTHDIVADSASNVTVNYVSTQLTRGTYTVDAQGTVTQVTTGY